MITAVAEVAIKDKLGILIAEVRMTDPAEHKKVSTSTRVKLGEAKNRLYVRFLQANKATKGER